jgi:DNA-binding CsgD family transcriptional regulator
MPRPDVVDSFCLRRAILYGLLGGALIAVVKYLELKYLVGAYPIEIYGGVLALLFTVLGLWFGLRSAPEKEKVVVREVRVPRLGPFEVDAEKLAELAITARELEILGLIAAGLSNKEIGERLFVSENTVKTHSSRLFQKLDVSRRTQAVHKGKDLGLIP